jgi:trehalose 6-phosphate phosphatase
MKHLLSPEGLERLRAFAAREPLFAFDMDGTLAPIVAHPDMAQVPDFVRERLAALSVHAPLAVITGRSVDDARRRVGVELRYLVGNHGAEGLPGREGATDAYRRTCEAWLRQLQESGLLAAAPIGVLLEDKRYSLALHYRLTADPVQAELDLHQLIARMAPAPRIVGGKFVLNLMPADAPLKGEALLTLMHDIGCQAAFYLGDDVTDEEVFRMQHPDILAVRVERHPDSHADFYVDDQAEVARAIDACIAALQEARRRPPRQMASTSDGSSAGATIAGDQP